MTVCYGHFSCKNTLMVFWGKFYKLFDFEYNKNIFHSLMAARNMPDYKGWMDCWRRLGQNVSNCSSCDSVVKFKFALCLTKIYLYIKKNAYFLINNYPSL